MISCLIIVLNEWWYNITGKAFVKDDGSMGTAAFFETIFEIFLTVVISILQEN
jgi:hypothetical protein